MYHSLGQPAVDLTRFPCIDSALCQSGGDLSLICCGNLPGAAGGTCMTRTSCTQAGYSERQAPALPALPGAQEEAPSIWENATAQIVVGVVVAVGVALTLNYLSNKTGRRYANNGKVLPFTRAARYPNWNVSYPDEEFDRTVELAIELTRADRRAGREAPLWGYSQKRFDEAWRTVRGANRQGAAND